MYRKAKVLANRSAQNEVAAETISKERRNRQRQNVGAEFAEDSHSESIALYLDMLLEIHGTLKGIRNDMESDVRSCKSNQNNVVWNKLRSCLADLETSTVLVSLLEHQNREFRKQFSIAMTQYLNNPDKTDFVRDPSRSISLSLGKWPSQSSGNKKNKKTTSSEDAIADMEMEENDEFSEEDANVNVKTTTNIGSKDPEPKKKRLVRSSSEPRRKRRIGPLDLEETH